MTRLSTLVLPLSLAAALACNAEQRQEDATRDASDRDTRTHTNAAAARAPENPNVGPGEAGTRSAVGAPHVTARSVDGSVQGDPASQAHPAHREEQAGVGEGRGADERGKVALPSGGQDPAARPNAAATK